jgi:hypothetical protein
MKHDRILCSYREPFGLTPSVMWAEPGSTFEGLVKAFPALPPEFAEEGTICLNGQPVPRDAWAIVRPRAPRPGRPMEVTFHLPPRGGGGGGGGKQLLAIAASFALSFAAGWIVKGGLATKFGLAKFASGTTLAWAAGAGVQVVGTLLLSALVPPPQSANSGRSATARFRNDGAASAEGNVLDPNGPLPRVVGEIKIFPPLALEPFTYFDGQDEVVEAVYCLGGPHRLNDIRVGAASVTAITGCEVEVREGWPGDAPLTLVRRQARTEALQSEVRAHTVDAENAALLDTTVDVLTSVPQASTVATRDAPDLHQLHLIFPSGLHFQGGATLIRVPLRLRIRRRGDVSWINLPELHFQAASLRQLRFTITLDWTPGNAPAPSAAPSEGFVEARRFSPGQTAAPVTDAWTAHPHFGTTGDVWASAANLGTTGVQNTSCSRYEARFKLNPAVFPPGRYEVEILRGCAIAASTYASSSYQVSGSVWDLFGYRNPAAPTIARSREQTSDSLLLLRSVSIWNETPVIAGDIALIAIRARNRQLEGVSVVAGGWVPDWDGTAWRSWAVTSNPAPHVRDILAGRLNADALPIEMLDDAGLLDFRAHCISKGYGCNAILEGQSAASAVEIVASCGYARPYASDRWGVAMDRDRTAEAPVQLFTPRNMSGFSWRRSMPRLPDGLRITFRDADRDYERRQITVLRPGGRDSGIFEQVEYEGFVHESDVRARAKYDLDQTLLRSTYYSFEAPAEAVVARRGSLVAVEHDTLGQASASATIATVWLNPAGLASEIDLDTPVPLLTRPGFAAITNFGAVADVSLIGATSAVMIRRTTGDITVHPVTGDGTVTTLTFAAPVSAAGLEEDVLVTVGRPDRHYLRAIVYDMMPREDYRVQMTLIDEAPEIHNG